MIAVVVLFLLRPLSFADIVWVVVLAVAVWLGAELLRAPVVIIDAEAGVADGVEGVLDAEDALHTVVLVDDRGGES